MPSNVASKLIELHLVEGEMVPGKEVSICVDQILAHDAASTGGGGAL